ncbi:MAG: DNA-binding response regulator, partial [Aeromicrobium sp.]|nr:DNA-binding response regulator [Aeromicrobium sp.]
MVHDGDMALVGICEDDADVRRVLTDALKMGGHRVVIARNGREAVENLGRDSGVEVLILDIGLPDADGRDVCQALRANGQHAPALFLTASDAVHDRVSGFHAGGDDYVVKPFAISEVLVRVESLAR